RPRAHLRPHGGDELQGASDEARDPQAVVPVGTHPGEPAGVMGRRFAVLVIFVVAPPAPRYAAVHAATRRCTAVKVRASGRCASDEARCIAEAVRGGRVEPGWLGEAEERLA